MQLYNENKNDILVVFFKEMYVFVINYNNMKYIIKTTIAIFISLNLYAQYDCSTARTIPQLDTCYQGYVNDSITELWFTFNVNDSSDYLIGFNQISGLPSAHPHSLRLYKGLCNSLSLMDSDTISLNDTILNVTTNGNGTYFLKITKAKAQTCSLYECKMSKSYFNLCFENTLLSSPLTVNLYSPTNPIIICSAMGITGWDCNSPVFSDCTYKPAQVCVGDVINFEVKNTPSSFNSTQGVIFKLYDNNFSLLGSSFITPPYTSNYFTVPFNNTDLVTYMQSQGNGNGPYSFSNKLLTVNGQLILNQDLTLFNSIIEMGKDAQIIINPGYKLNLD
ncbi:MAG: hypothetical protein Kow0079_03490 [Vicingaceae bacterium]